MCTILSNKMISTDAQPSIVYKVYTFRIPVGKSTPSDWMRLISSNKYLNIVRGSYTWTLRDRCLIVQLTPEYILSKNPRMAEKSLEEWSTSISITRSFLKSVRNGDKLYITPTNMQIYKELKSFYIHVKFMSDLKELSAHFVRMFENASFIRTYIKPLKLRQQEDLASELPM